MANELVGECDNFILIFHTDFRFEPIEEYLLYYNISHMFIAVDGFLTNVKSPQEFIYLHYKDRLLNEILTKPYSMRILRILKAETDKLGSKQQNYLDNNENT